MNQQSYCRAAFWMSVFYMVVVALALVFPVYEMVHEQRPLSMLLEIPNPFVVPLRVFLIHFLNLIVYAGIYALFASFVEARFFYRVTCGDANTALAYHVAMYIPLLLWWSAPCLGSLLVYYQGGASYQNSAGEVVHFGMAAVPSAGVLLGGFFVIMLPFWLRIGAVFTE